MQPNIKSPYFALSLFLALAVFGQAGVISTILKDQVVRGAYSSSLTSISYGIGLLLTGLAAVCYYRSTKQDQAFKKQLVVFVSVPILLAPAVIFIISLIMLLPLYGLVNSM